MKITVLIGMWAALAFSGPLAAMKTKLSGDGVMEPTAKKPKTLSQEYQNHQREVIASEVIDPITLEDFSANAAIVLRQDRRAFKGYDIDSAYELFIKRSSANPFTRLPMAAVQLERIKLYKKYFDRFNNQSVYEKNIDELFVSYLDTKGAGTNEADLLILERGLVFGVSDKVFSNLGTKLSDMDESLRDKFAELAKEALADKAPGSWIIRPSKLEDSEEDKIFVRTISIRTKEGTAHARLFHVWGYGFGLPKEDRFSLVTIKDVALDFSCLRYFPSLVQVLIFLSESKHKLDLSKYRRVEKSAYSTSS